MNRNIAQALGEYLANIGVLYIKLHNLHWNVIGPDFKAVHEYLETLYDGFADALDSVAELLKMNGEAPLASLRAYLDAASISELDSAERRSPEVLQIVQDDLHTLSRQAEDIRSLADAEQAYAVVSLMEGQLAEYSKTLWFIQAMRK